MNRENTTRKGRHIDVEQTLNTEVVGDEQSPQRQPRTFVPDEQNTLKDMPESVCLEDEVSAAGEFEDFQLDSKPLRGLKWFLGLSLSYVTALLIFNAYELLVSAWNTHWLLGTGLATVVGSILLSGCVVIRSWIKDEDNVSGIQKFQKDAVHFREVRSHGNISGYLNDLSSFYALKPQARAFNQAMSSLPDYADDKESVAHIEQAFLTQLDQQAHQCVSKYSVQTGLAVALSPWASMDMLFTLWRNAKMVEEIAKIYGIRPSYRNRIKILTLVLKNMAFAGVSQMTGDYVASIGQSHAIPQTIAGVGQGIGSALISVRIGILTMKTCRPIPFEEGKQPKLMGFMKSVTDSLLDSLRSARELRAGPEK